METLYQNVAPHICLVPESHALDGIAGPVDLYELSETESLTTFGDMVPDEMLEMEPALATKLRCRLRLSAANLPVSAALVNETGALVSKTGASAVFDFILVGIAAVMHGVVLRPLVQRLKYHIMIVNFGQDSLSMEARALTDVLIGEF